MTIDPQPIIDQIEGKISPLYGIYLFGSQATGQATPHSDIDLAVLSDTKLKPLDLYNIAQTIALKLDKDIDLVDLRSVSTVFATQIVAHAKRIYCTDEYICESFEGLVFAKYVRLNEQRQIILDEIKKTGRVYERRTNK